MPQGNRRFADDREVAGQGIAARQTLKVWRLRRRRGEEVGPPFYSFGRKVVYDLDEVSDWCERHRVGPKVEGSGAAE